MAYSLFFSAPFITGLICQNETGFITKSLKEFFLFLYPHPIFYHCNVKINARARMECLRQNNKKNIDFQTKQKMIIARKKEAGKRIF